MVVVFWGGVKGFIFVRVREGRRQSARKKSRAECCGGRVERGGEGQLRRARGWRGCVERGRGVLWPLGQTGGIACLKFDQNVAALHRQKNPPNNQPAAAAPHATARSAALRGRGSTLESGSWVVDQNPQGAAPQRRARHTTKKSKTRKMMLHAQAHAGAQGLLLRPPLRHCKAEGLLSRAIKQTIVNEKPSPTPLERQKTSYSPQQPSSPGAAQATRKHWWGGPRRRWGGGSLLKHRHDGATDLNQEAAPPGGRHANQQQAAAAPQFAQARA